MHIESFILGALAVIFFIAAIIVFCYIIAMVAVWLIKRFALWYWNR